MTPLNDTVLQSEIPNQPDVVKWFKVYCGIVCLFSLCFVPVSWMFFLVPPTDMSESEANFMGLGFLGVSLVSAAMFVVPFCVTTRPWLWTYGLVLICFGLTSAGCFPACVPLLIFWIKPETKRFFGKS